MAGAIENEVGKPSPDSGDQGQNTGVIVEPTKECDEVVQGNKTTTVFGALIGAAATVPN